MQELRIIVCAKQVPDPEAPASEIKIDLQAKEISLPEVVRVVNPFDENALEAALRIKKECGGTVTVLSGGAGIDEAVMRKTLAVGADELILLDDSHFKNLDSWSTAFILAAAIKKIGGYDLILTGRQASDWDFGQTGAIIAEMLDIPSMNLARSIKVEDGSVIVEKVKPNGYELVKAKMPALVAASNEIGELRYASFIMLREAKKKPIKVWGAGDLDIDLQRLRKIEIVELYLPDIERKCCFMEGELPEEKGENLVRCLKEAKII